MELALGGSGGGGEGLRRIQNRMKRVYNSHPLGLEVVLKGASTGRNDDSNCKN